jgi:hypothetical protein
MKLKSYITLVTLLFSTTLLFAQKTDKIKGSGVIKIALKEIESFNSIEVEDNIIIDLEKGETSGIRIEADDNLHEIINCVVQNNVLIVSTSKEAHGFKKLSVRITYTDDLNLVTSKDEAIVNAIQEISVENITFKSRNKSKLFLNANVTNFNLQSDDKSKVELNLKSENAFIELSNNSSLKALINSAELKCDLYQKAIAIIEGDADNAIARLDNSSELNARNFNAKNIDITVEDTASCSVLGESSCTIEAGDKAEINLYGNPTINIRKLSGEAKLFKKLTPKK